MELVERMKPKSNSCYFFAHFCKDNMFSFYKTFVENKSRFQFYGKSERKHVKYFLKNAQFTTKVSSKKNINWTKKSFDKVWSKLFGVTHLTILGLKIEIQTTKNFKHIFYIVVFILTFWNTINYLGGHEILKNLTF